MTDERIVQAGELRLARVESLRALAALAVLTGHVWGTAHDYRPVEVLGTFWRRAIYAGGFGVFVFYALSGFLLFWPFVRATFGGGERIDLRRYAINRVLRILPLYFFAVVVLLIVQNGGGTATLWWRHLLFLQPMWADSLNAVDGPLWSVVVEIQFYALLPLIAAALAAASGRRRLWAAALLVVAGAASWALRQKLANGSDPWSFQLPTTFLYFVAGMLVALLRDAWEARRPGWLDSPLGSSTLWFAASLPLWAIVVWHYEAVWLCAPAAFLMVGALVLPLRRGAAVDVLEWRPLAVLGVASYSLYVWHVPIIDAVRAHTDVLTRPFPAALAVCAVLSIAAAFASYRLVEAPPLRLRRRWAPAAAEHVDA